MKKLILILTLLSAQAKGQSKLFKEPITDIKYMFRVVGYDSSVRDYVTTRSITYYTHDSSIVIKGDTMKLLRELFNHLYKPSK